MANILPKFENLVLGNLSQKAMCFLIQVVQTIEMELIVVFVIKIIIRMIVGFTLQPNNIVPSQSHDSNCKINDWLEKQRKPLDKPSHLSSQMHWPWLIVILAFNGLDLEQHVRNQNRKLSNSLAAFS